MTVNCVHMALIQMIGVLLLVFVGGILGMLLVGLDCLLLFGGLHLKK